ncbi:T-cell surface glycoprotein CD8 alpha chain-like protein [Anopheles sinensis]|uniref:T-cell surface glycoprotein CD8 alpha chain-like protein n=1 Tax=Anopheles sinensis TaxID=74873 RepID=A0A084VPZ6_ANOSI|nr:T-cell surface glycoprotein CD8 alpha chain-like protein [Anopheles sinensis]
MPKDAGEIAAFSFGGRISHPMPPISGGRRAITTSFTSDSLRASTEPWTHTRISRPPTSPHPGRWVGKASPPKLILPTSFVRPYHRCPCPSPRQRILQANSKKGCPMAMLHAPTGSGNGTSEAHLSRVVIEDECAFVCGVRFSTPLPNIQPPPGGKKQKPFRRQ